MRALRLAILVVGLLVLAAAASQAEVTQKGILRVAFEGKISPHSLPRTGAAPISVSIGGQITTTDESPAPQLRTITIQINRRGRLDYRGLPDCARRQIQPSTNLGALAACRDSLVGEGHFSANVLFPEQAPFPSEGKVLAFNGTLHGRPVIFAHVYGKKPAPVSYTLPFEITRAKGTFATTLRASLPQVTADWGYVTGLSMTLARRFHYEGQRRSYLSAGCPAPKGFPGGVFPFARAAFAFEGGRTLSSTLTRSCGVKEKPKVLTAL
jgi:hypothetical protein